MNTRQQILFDLDDTLIHCNKYFGMVLDQFDQLIRNWFNDDEITSEEILQKQLEIDIASVHHVGFKSGNFPQSLIQTYRYFCQKFQRLIYPQEEDQLLLLGNSVYELEVEPYPGMIETLESLKSDGHQLHLYTGGESAIQQRKIDQMKLNMYFDERIYIREHKNTDSLEQILRNGRFDRSSTWMIGNSLRTDVLPALTAGICSIYIQISNEWEYNIVELNQTPEQILYTATSIHEVPELIEHKIEHELKQRTLD
ncbi:HAD family hydrolase [Paenibacillus crassostreae]|uniref:HAD family hydrolase n=1 Tax=Paenibacillus crassostreae TaxID=1763538 RepID=A0A167DTE4_9BACL|nr:HAD hydrolase-like protein [Paenibacillus crassostreae]AOZ91085.1 HAD family hydrolase [Paenibacillus crassostreae]OAB74755.1 HAD family hydrolase [Paenibacillus crassostreae]